MITNQQIRLLSVLLFLYQISISEGCSQTLIEGKKAPDINKGIAIKGTPDSKFKNGHVYMVEFGGVGCAPCRASIPHLSEVADRYRGKASLISVYTQENGAFPPKDTVSIGYLEKVKRFVTKMGEQIRYDVLVDNPAQDLYRTWMRASGQSAIPRVFIIDQSATMVWSGHPKDVDKVIEAVVENRFDPHESTYQMQTTRAISAKVVSLARAGQPDLALIYMDSLMLLEPGVLMNYDRKFRLLLDSDERQAYQFGWEALKGACKDAEAPLYYMARAMLDRYYQLEKADWPLAIALTSRALTLCKSEIVSASILENQAQAYYYNQQPQEAVLSMNKAVAYLRQYPEESGEMLKLYESKLKTLIGP